MNTDNIWIAVGDETGQFDEKSPNANTFHGVAMILAKQKDLQDAFQQTLLGKTIQQRLSSCLDGLNNSNKHHVFDVWNYLREHNITGEHHLNNIPNLPKFIPLYTLGETFKWLIQQKNLISIGIYANNAADIMQNFTHSKDNAHIIGALCGKMLGLVAPFLGDNATIVAFPPLRKEHANNPSIKYAGVPENIDVNERGMVEGYLTGFARTLFAETYESFHNTRKAFNALNTKTKCETEILVRRMFKNDDEIIKESRSKLQSAVNFVSSSHGKQLEALADLVCSLMRCAYEENIDTEKKVGIKIPKNVVNNFYFWNINYITNK